MNRIVLAAVFATVALPAMAQQPPALDDTFAQEFTGLVAAIDSASVARQHVVESARALIADWAKRGAEVEYWHRWIDGEKAQWGTPKP